MCFIGRSGFSGSRGYYPENLPKTRGRIYHFILPKVCPDMAPQTCPPPPPPSPSPPRPGPALNKIVPSRAGSGPHSAELSHSLINQIAPGGRKADREPKENDQKPINNTAFRL